MVKMLLLIKVEIGASRRMFQCNSTLSGTMCVAIRSVDYKSEKMVFAQQTSWQIELRTLRCPECAES